MKYRATRWDLILRQQRLPSVCSHLNVRESASNSGVFERRSDRQAGESLSRPGTFPMEIHQTELEWRVLPPSTRPQGPKCHLPIRLGGGDGFSDRGAHASRRTAPYARSFRL